MLTISLSVADTAFSVPDGGESKASSASDGTGRTMR
jgi:hypothetical protein